jgi:hypothetical protein
MLMVIYTLHTQGPRFVESHICQNRADMGHPSSVTEQAVRNAGESPDLVSDCWAAPTRTGPFRAITALKRPIDTAPTTRASLWASAELR